MSWETTAEPRLWVIGRYQMGFDLADSGAGSTLRVHIRYAHPASGISRLLGFLFGRFYARWCTGQMVTDAHKHFARLPQGRAPMAPDRAAGETSVSRRAK
jgi:hypothetical protein